MDDEIQRWSRETVEGRKFYNNCDKAEAKYTTSSLFVNIRTAQDNEEEEPQEYASSASEPQNQRNGASRGRGGRSRGRGSGNNNRTPGPRSSLLQSKDSECYNQYQQGQDGKLLLNEKGQPRCYYCGIPYHTRSDCRNRLKDVENGIKRPSHLNRGNMSSNDRYQARKASQARPNAEQWGNGPTPPRTPQAPQTAMAQRNGTDLITHLHQ